jgi:hypothetical protein
MIGDTPLTTAASLKATMEQELALLGDVSDETWALFLRHVDALSVQEVLSILALLSAQ